MKAFVIKNKEGKYRGNSYIGDVREIRHAEIYDTLEEIILDDGEKPVEITIVEGNFDAYIDTLQDERDFERRDKTLIVKQLNDPNDYVIREDYRKLETENKHLKEQLADKDKEIDKLSEEHLEMFGDMKDYKNLWLAEQRKSKQIRKQVCDAIFKELQENVDCYFEERKCNSPHSQLPYIWFNEIRFRKFLDQIEQGE